MTDTPKLDDTTNASPTEISKTPNFKDLALSLESYECSICLEHIKTGNDVCICACGHVFHAECLFDVILNGDSLCPNCRAKMTFPSLFKHHSMDQIKKMNKKIDIQLEELQVLRGQNMERENLINNLNEIVQEQDNELFLLKDAKRRMKMYKKNLEKLQKKFDNLQFLYVKLSRIRQPEQPVTNITQGTEQNEQQQNEQPNVEQTQNTTQDYTEILMKKLEYNNGKIYNPNTGRKVQMIGKIGHAVLKTYGITIETAMNIVRMNAVRF